MGEPVFLQFPILGGLDQQTAATYLDPQANQSNILNGNFAHVGAVNKRQGIQFDQKLASAVVLNPNGIANAYVSPASYATSLAALGGVILQGPWAWELAGQTAAFAGKLSNLNAVRRPLPVHSLRLPLVCDGVVALTGPARALAWVDAPDDPVGTSIFQIQSAFVDPSTSQRLLTFPTLQVTGFNVTLLNLVWFPLTGVLTLFVVVETAGLAARELRAYNITPANNDNAWTLQAGATLALHNNDADCIDVQPFSGDPSSGYLVLYLAAGVTNQLTWRYFVNYASSATGTLAVSTLPGNTPMHIVADWAIDVAFVWSDLANPDFLHVDYLSGDGLFTALATYSANPNITAALGSFAYTLWQLGGACRVYSKTNVTLNSEIYLAFWATDGTIVNGPVMPVTMGGLVARSTVNVVTPMGFVYYPFGFRPLARPVQIDDGLQVTGAFIHVSHPCIQDYQIGAGTNPLATTPISEQCTEYIVDYRVSAQVGVPLAIRTAEATVVTTIAPRQCDPYVERWSNAKYLPASASSDRKKILTALALSSSSVAGKGADVSLMWLVEVSPAAAPQTALINDTMELSGGLPMRLGPLATEHGFVNFPEFMVATVGAGPGLTGTYSYAVCYARQDAAGNIERSAPNLLSAPIVLANQQAQLTFPKLSWNNYGGNYFVEVYRTLTLGSTYFLVQRIGADSFGAGPYGFYVDSMDDNQLGKASLLYTTGGVLDNVNPPAAAMMCAHRGRLAIVDETKSQVWFTKQETPGEVMGFNEVLIQPFIEGGDITAIASLDDKFVALKASSVWIMFGDGPGDTGQGSDWTIPQMVPTDAGCISAASVVTIPAGLVFQSLLGLHMLGRDNQVIFLGKAVKDLTSVYTTCISAVVVPAAKQARWLMQDANGNQLCIVYDFFLNQWTTHRYDHLDSAIAQILLVNNVFTIVTVNGTRYAESATSWLDKDSAAALFFVPTSITLPWVKVSGPQGYQRSRRTLVYAELEDAAGISVSLAYNYDPATKKTASWTFAELRARPTEQVEARTPAQFSKCQSLQVTLTDTDDAAKVTGQGMTFQAVGFDLDKIGDRYRRLPARLKG